MADYTFGGYTFSDPSGPFDPAEYGRYLREKAKQKLGYPQAVEPYQAVTSSDIPTQTGIRPEPEIKSNVPDIPADRGEMIAANILRTTDRNKAIINSVAPGSYSQEQFLKELEELKKLDQQVAERRDIDLKNKELMDTILPRKYVLNPVTGRSEEKWDLGKIDPNYGYQSYEAILNYQRRLQGAAPTATPQQNAERAARETPVPAAPARAAAPEAAGAGREDQIRYGERAIRGGKNVFWSGDPNYGFQSAGSIQKLKEEKFRQNVLLPALLGSNPPAGIKQLFGMGK